MVADNIFIGVTVVELLKSPFFGIVAHGSFEDGEYLVAVVAMVVGLEFLGQALPVFVHRAEPDAVRVEIPLFRDVRKDEASGGFGAFACQPDVVLVDAFG